MKKIVVFWMLLLPLSTIAQSEYYYEKGAFWVREVVVVVTLVQKQPDFCKACHNQ